LEGTSTVLVDDGEISPSEPIIAAGSNITNGDHRPMSTLSDRPIDASAGGRTAELRRAVRRQLGIESTSVILTSGLSSQPASADDTVFNTDTLSFTDNGAPATSLDGTPPATVSEANGVASFNFDGNLDFGSTDTVTAIGSNALSIQAGNNVTIAPGATFNASAQGSVSGAGGGAGGMAAHRSPPGWVDSAEWAAICKGLTGFSSSSRRMISRRCPHSQRQTRQTLPAS
jgi:hypothetical protein